jgi:hypothetical protein
MRSIGGERSVVGGSTLPMKVAFMAEVAAETADGLVLLVDECQGRMLADHFAKLIQLAVDAFLPERRVERARVEENVDVFREPRWKSSRQIMEICHDQPDRQASLDGTVRLANRCKVRGHPAGSCLVGEEPISRIEPQQVVLVAALPQQLAGEH